MCRRGISPRLGGRKVNLEELEEVVMGSVTVQGQPWGAGPPDRAEVAEMLVQLSCGNFRITSRVKLSLSPVSATLGGIGSHAIRPA
jgi:hypothetical protein